MGRYASFTVYRRKLQPSGEEYGNYVCYSPIAKRVIDLGTTDYNDALAEVERHRNGASAQDSSSGTQSTMESANPEPTTPVQSPVTNTDPLTALNNYLSQTNDSSEQPTPSATPRSEAIPSGTASPGIQPGPGVGRTNLVNLPQPRTKAKGLTPEQAEKISQALSKGAAKLNLAIDEVVVSIAGFKVKDDLELDDTDIAFLKLGWEMQLEQWFQKSNPEPWHLILIGNAFIIMTLLKNSERKKRDKRDEQTTA